MEVARNTRGALFMALAMAGFTMNDAAVKAVLPSMNIGQVMLIRGVLTTMLVYLIARRLGALSSLSALRQPAVLMRVLFESGAAVAYLTALQHLPLGNAAAIMQSLPLAVTVGAAVFLAEAVGWRRWTAIGVGFLGVMIILRPGPDGFSPAAVFAVLAVALAAGRDVCTRRIPPGTSSLMVTLLTTAANGLLGALLIVPYGGWTAPAAADFGLIALASVLLFIGHQSIVIAMRTAELSFIAPFRYTGLLWGVVLGIVFFGERFDPIMLVGAAIVIASGLYTCYRENLRRGVRPATTTGAQP